MSILQDASNSKAVCFTSWFAERHSLTCAALYPQLTSFIQFHKFTFSRYRYVRAIQYRLWQRLRRRLLYPVMLRFLNKKYNVLFAVDTWQIPFWRKSIVVDIHDPNYEPQIIELLKLPQIEAAIVSTDRAREALQDLGMTAPIHVIPQMVAMEVNQDSIREVQRRFKPDSDIVVGYLAAGLSLLSDGPRRPRNGLDDLDFLFAALEEARTQEPRIKAWLLGEPTRSLRRYVKTRPWITLLGYVPSSEIFSYVSNFDIGVYPRTLILPPGAFSVKLVQYMACGVPIVATGVEEAQVVREAGCGFVCVSQLDFTRALVSLAGSPELRARLGARGREHAQRNLDRAFLVSRYEKVIRSVLRAEG